MEFLIKQIKNQIKVWDDMEATHQIDAMPVFYN